MQEKVFAISCNVPLSPYYVSQLLLITSSLATRGNRREVKQPQRGKKPKQIFPHMNAQVHVYSHVYTDISEAK